VLARRYLHQNSLVGALPSQLGLLTALTRLCVPPARSPSAGCPLRADLCEPACASFTCITRPRWSYTLQGPLAQFSRSGLVQEFVRRMVADFGRNVSQRLAYPDTLEAPQAQAMNPVGVLFSIVWQKIKSLFGVR
jgi:hypothetical protein